MSSDKMIESFMSEIDISKTSDNDLENNSFIDIFGNRYNFYTLKGENIVSVTFLSDDFDIDYYLELLKKLGEKTVIEFSFSDSCDCDKVNEVIDVLHEYPIKRKVFLDVREVKFSHFDKIGLEKLDENTKITCMGVVNEYRNTPIHKECSFEWWFLHNFPNDEKFYRKFGNVTGDKLFKLYWMISMFKKNNPDILNMTVKEKCERAYLYIKKNFTKKKIFNFSNKTGDKSSSAIDVYKKMNGDSFGYSSLMKCFLNNQYIGVPCYLVDCNYNADEHELCQISTLVGDEYYYDLKNDVNGVESLDDSYSSLDFSDIENSKVRERRENAFKHGVLIKR